MKHFFILISFLLPSVVHSQILNEQFENTVFDSDTMSVCELYAFTENDLTNVVFGLEDQSGRIAYATLSNIKENVFLWEFKVTGNPGCVEKVTKGVFTFQGGTKMLATMNKTTLEGGLSCTGSYYFVLSPTENRELLKTFYIKDLLTFSIAPTGGKYTIKFKPKEASNIRDLMKCMNP